MSQKEKTEDGLETKHSILRGSFTQRLNYFSRISIVIIAFVLVSSFLKQTAGITSTLFTGLLLGLVFSPITWFLCNKFRFPLFLAILCTVMLFFILSFVFVILLYNSLSSVSAYFAFYRDKVSTIINSIVSSVSHFNINLTVVQELQNGFFFFLRELALSLSTGAINIGKNYLIISLTLIFTIVELFWIKTKAKYIFSDSNREKTLELLIEETTHSISKFILLKTIISFVTAVIVYTTFKLVGVNFPLLWAFLTFLFNFIPSIGSLIISVVSILFSILQFYPSWVEVIIITVIILLTQNIIGNIIDPSITGDSLNLSALVILIGLVYWGYVWGIMGMLLSVPLLVLIRITCQHIPYLRKLSIILGSGAILSKKKHKISQFVDSA